MAKQWTIRPPFSGAASLAHSLGMPTIDDNLEMIHRYRADLLDYLDPAVDDPEERDRIRLQLAESWLFRGDYDLAIEATEQLSEGQFREEADRIRTQAEILDGSL